MASTPSSHRFPNKASVQGQGNNGTHSQLTSQLSSTEWLGQSRNVRQQPPPDMEDRGIGERRDAVLRHHTHTRLSTWPIPTLPKSAEASLTASGEESEVEAQTSQIVYKKSGELVRPALRPASHRHSLPGTPTRSKFVHFDPHEDIRYFLRLDRPLAVSDGSSPSDGYESDDEYPSSGEKRFGAGWPQHEWEIIKTAFPAATSVRRALPVRLERVWLSDDQKCLLGSVAVANLAFQKCVTCRFTLDSWETRSEVAARYTNEIPSTDGISGYDRFSFAIGLSDVVELEAKTLCFCLRYNVDGREFWDNNNSANFQINFQKNDLPQKGKKSFQGASTTQPNRRLSTSIAQFQKSRRVDEFGDRSNLDFNQPLGEHLDETGPAMHLKSNKYAGNLPNDNLSCRLPSSNGNGLANRYDFDTSLSVAAQAAKDSTSNEPDGLYTRQHKRAVIHKRTQPNAKESVSDRTGAGAEKTAPLFGSASSNTTLASASYQDLVNKYCFFNSNQSSTFIKEGTQGSACYYGGIDDSFTAWHAESTPSSFDGSLRVGEVMYRHLHLVTA